MHIGDTVQGVTYVHCSCLKAIVFAERNLGGNIGDTALSVSRCFSVSLYPGRFLLSTALDGVVNESVKKEH